MSQIGCHGLSRIGSSRMTRTDTDQMEDQKTRNPIPSVLVRTGISSHPSRDPPVFSRSHRHGFDAGVQRSEEPTEHPCPSVPVRDRASSCPSATSPRVQSIARHGFDTGVQGSEDHKENPSPSVPVRDRAFFASIRDLASCSVDRIVTDSTPANGAQKNRKKIRVLPCSSVTRLLRVHPRPRLLFSRSHRHGFDAGVPVGRRTERKSASFRARP